MGEALSGTSPLSGVLAKFLFLTGFVCVMELREDTGSASESFALGVIVIAHILPALAVYSLKSLV